MGEKKSALDSLPPKQRALVNEIAREVSWNVAQKMVLEILDDYLPDEAVGRAKEIFDSEKKNYLAAKRLDDAVEEVARKDKEASE